MNPLILTKTAKFTLIGSASAFLAFTSRLYPNVKLFFVYGYIGLLVICIVVILWEGRNQIESSEPTEEGLNRLLSSMNVNANPKPKREYLLSSQARLELVIFIAVVTICALVGAI